MPSAQMSSKRVSGNLTSEFLREHCRFYPEAESSSVDPMDFQCDQLVDREVLHTA